MAREILQSHDWVTLHWNYAPWFLKPPLVMWLQALLFQVAGPTELAARLPSAVAGTALVLLSFVIARRLYGTAAGVVAAIVLLTGEHVVQQARFGTTDVVLTLLLYLSARAYLEVREGRRRWWLGVGAALGLAFMTKGAAAVMGVAALGGAAFLDGILVEELRHREVWLGGLLLLAVALPWHAAEIVREGPAFLHRYIAQEVVDRSSHTFEEHGGGPAYYVLVLRNRLFPWFYLGVVAAVLAVADAYRGRGGSWAVPVMPAMVFLFVTILPTKLPWYVLPVYPGLAIMIGGLLARAWKGELLALSGAAVACLAAAASVPHFLPAPPGPWRLGLVAVVALSGLAGWVAARSVRPAVAALVGAFALIGLGYVAPLYRPIQEPVARIADIARADGGGSDVAALQRHPLLVLIGRRGAIPDTAVWPQGLFYIDRPLRSAATIDVLVTMAGAGPAEVVMDERDLDGLPPGFRFQAKGRSFPLVYGVLTRA